MFEDATYDLFISYAEADRAWVEGYLLDALVQAQVNCLSEAAFQLGVPRIQEFQRAVQQSRRTLLVLSPAYIADDSSQFVDLLGQTYGQNTQTWPVIPLLLEPTPIPPRLAMLVGLNATTPEDQEQAITRLCADLQRPLSTSVTKPSCPYPGMVPFSEAEQDCFFGRDQEINELVERLRSHPFVTVIGPSGSGKSSLVFAGLIPRLKQTSLFGSGNWLIYSMRPGTTPVQTLQALLEKDLANPAQAIEHVLSTHPNSQRLLLVVDQFEELFTQRGPETEPFQHLILKCLEVAKCYIVLTIRADFYADLMVSPLWHSIQSSRMEVIPLNETHLRQAIVKPAEKVGVFVEPTLVERLVDDAVGEPGALPLVQETLVLLWDRVERRFLPLRAYEALVLTREVYGTSNKGHRSGLQVAIARRADAALASLRKDPEQQLRIARRIFIRLIQFGEGRADTRRQQLVSDLQAAKEDAGLFQQTLAHLVNCRLLTSDQDAEKPSLSKIDIAHEALISGWPMLQQWISEYRDAEQTYRRLLDKTREWERLGKKDGGLLDEIELAEAGRWLTSFEAVELGYNKDIEELITNSKQFIRKSKNEKRTRLITTGGLILTAVSIVLGTWYKDYQDKIMQTAELELRLGNVTSEYLEKAPKVMQKRMELLENAARKNDDDQVLQQARTILDVHQKIREKVEGIRGQRTDTNNSKNSQLEYREIDRERVNSLAQQAESFLIKTIILNRTPRLENYLQKGIIGERKGNYAPGLLADGYTEGAVRETYTILMIDAGADSNQSGILTVEEADRIPCELLKEIERVWRNLTRQKCGWYGSEDPLIAQGCNELQEVSLTAMIFFNQTRSVPMNRLDQCGFKRPQDDALLP